MATERVKFARNYDHTWPNRAMTAYKAGFEGQVKAEVAERAGAVGALDDAMPTTRAELEKLAGDEGVDVSAIEGTGSRGYVTNDDITGAILAKRAGDQGEPGAAIGGGDASGAEAPSE